MAQRVFLDLAVKPTASMLAKALGSRLQYWNALKRHVPGSPVEEWKYYGKSGGWALKLLLGKKNLLFMAPYENSFAVSFILGDKGVALAGQSSLSPELIDRLAHAKKYVEGRGIRIVVSSRNALKQAEILADIKIASWHAA